MSVLGQGKSIPMTEEELNAEKKFFVDLVRAAEGVKEGINGADRAAIDFGCTRITAIVDAMARRKNIILTRPVGAPKAVINAQDTQD